MQTKKFNNIIVLGLIATIGILIVQLLWTKETYNLEEKKFSQKTHVALLEVVKKLYLGTNSELPTENPINKIANDYYIVNVENDFEPEVLEYYLKTEFEKFNIATDFEYAMYNCNSDEMVYGNYISMTDKSKSKKSISFPKHKNLVYYFAIRFPNQTTFLLSSLRFWVLLSLALIFILLIYVYSIYTIIQQKKYSELQRDFINNMTHEFKTPLSSILLASSFLNKQQVIKDNPKLHSYTDIIIDQSKKLNSHIEKVLTIAKSDASPLDLQKSKINVCTVLNNVAENMHLKHEKLDLKLICNESLIIDADEFHFTNIVYNLIDNSIKYCNENPVITIEAIENQNQIQLNFTDNGIGISEKNISFIFDKFFRVSDKKSNEVNGFGLGLYYVKQICTQHNWKINAKNNESHGITISLIMPK